MEFLQDFYMPIVLAFCFVIGAALKKASFFDDRYIPLLMCVIGCIFGAIAGGFDFTAIASGGISGWASTGLDQTIKQLTKSE